MNLLILPTLNLVTFYFSAPAPMSHILSIFENSNHRGMFHNYKIQIADQFIHCLTHYFHPGIYVSFSSLLAPLTEHPDVLINLITLSSNSSLTSPPTRFTISSLVYSNPSSSTKVSSSSANSS